MSQRTSTIVLLHGQPGSRSDWDAVIAALPPGTDAVALDRPGYHSSPFPPGSLEDNATWLIRELDDAGIDNAILVGHSYGGGVALAAATQAPERVRGLVLLASVGPECLNGWDTLLAAPVAGPVCSVMAFSATPWFARKFLSLKKQSLRRPLANDEFVYTEIWGNSAHDHGKAWRTFLTEQRELVRKLDDLTARLDSVKTPTLIAADPADSVVPHDTAHALNALLPNSTLEWIEGGGHHLPRRKPTDVAQSITRFVASLN